MKGKTKFLTLVLCLSVFALMAIGSGSDSSDLEDGKDIVSTGSQDTVNKANVTIEEKVILDKDGVVITAKEYVYDSIWGEGIKLLIENKSDKTLTVGCNALIVNNYMISDLFVEEVAAGKKANETLYLSSSELQAAGIESVGQIEIYFHVYESESYDDVIESEHVTIQTSQYANMDTTPNDIGTELLNEKGIKVVGKTVDENSFWGAGILLYCENKSGKNIRISVEEMSINGFMINPFFSAGVYDGKMAIDSITIFSSDLEENDIEKIEEVELKFKVYDEDTYDTIIETEVIKFSAQ